MKKAVFVFLLTFLTINSKVTYPHGFGTHAAHYASIIALNDQYRALIENTRYKPYFIYGSIFPDIQYAANYKTSLLDLYQKIEDLWGVEGASYIISVDQIPNADVIQYPFGINTHNDKYGLAFAEYLLQQCAPINPPGPNPGSNGTTIEHDARNMKLAFALGYYAHLTEDVAAHDFLVPKLTAALNLGDIELIKNSETFVQDPNSQTEGIIEGILDYYYGDNNLIADIIYNHVWVTRSQYEPTIAEMDFTTGYAHLWYDGPTPTYYDALGGWPEMNPVLLFFHEVLNNWYNNNPFSLPTGEYREDNSPISANGLTQLATVFRFVNRFYPAIAGHPFNGYDRLDQVLANWVGTHIDLEDGFELLEVLAEFTYNLSGHSFRKAFFEGFVYPKALASTSEGLTKDARSLVSIMLADMQEADMLVNSQPDKINIVEYNKLKNSILFTNPTSVLNAYWNEYKNLGTKIYDEVGPLTPPPNPQPGKWYYDWSPYHAHSMAWGALSSLNILISDIYTTNPNVAVYDAYFEVNGNRITGPQPASAFNNNPIVKVVVELYNTSNVSSESITLRVKKDHSSTNYTSDVLKISTSFTIDHDPLNYNTTARKRVELPFTVSLSELTGYKGYYFELVKNSNNKVMFSSSFEQYQERLDLTPNYTRLYGTYDEGKWPVSLGLTQSVATVNLASPQFPEGGSGGSYKINGITQTSIIGYVDDYIQLEAVPPTGYLFYQWSDGNTENPRNYRITSTNVNMYSVYKGIQRSNNPNAYSTSSQRKFVRTDDGNLHSVYESMGKAWYELSTNNGTSWQIANNGQPLSGNAESKLPAIDYRGNIVVIVWQEKNGGAYNIEAAKFSSFGIKMYGATIFMDMDLPYSSNTNPLVAYDGEGRILFMWKRAEDNIGYWPIGIVFSYGALSSFGWNEYDFGVIPATNSNSINPTIVADKDYNLIPAEYHLAWEQPAGSYTDLKYFELYRDGYNKIKPRTPSPETPSSGAGFWTNRKPSIIVLVDHTPRLVWIGYTPWYGSRTVFRAKQTNGLWSSTIYSYSSYSTESVNINRTTDGNYVIGWSEVNGSAFSNKYVRSTTLSAIKNFGTTGKDIQINNGANFYSQYANSFQSVTAPYSFSISNSVGNIGKEQAGSLIASGREGVVYKEDAQFYFTLGDVIVNEQHIEFVDVPDTLNISSREILNGYLISNPFEVNDNSIFTYGVQYGITDSARGYEFLDDNDFINFKVELRDDATGELLGLFDDITFTKINLNQYNNISYQVNTQGIGNRTVRLKLVVNDNLDPGYSLTHIYADESVLPKAGHSTVSYKGSLAVESYDLAQNYPNPFNPSTTIKLSNT